MPKNNERNQVGALIVFPEGMTKDQVERLLHNFIDKESMNGVRYSVNEFNPDWGGPVWYIP